MTTNAELLSPETIKNPYPIYEKLRGKGPHLLDDTNIWLITDYDDICFILKNNLFLKAGYEYLRKKVPGKVLNLPIMSSYLRMFHRINPPQHTRLRGLLVKDFTIKIMNKLEERITEIANDIIDNNIERGEMDLINDFGYPLTRTVISEIMGIPKDAVEILAKKKGLLIQSQDLDENSLDVIWKINHDILVMRKLFTKLCNEKNPSLDGDLISKLVYMRDIEKSIDQDELLANLMFVFFAGHETAKDTISVAFLSFQRNPEQFELLKNNRELIPNAIEEILRYEPAVQYLQMYASDDVSLNTVTLKKGDIVALFLGAGNRDPKVFENPQKFDITRDVKKNKHITFNLGIHTCLGLHLARLEIKVVLETILKRIPNIKVDIDNLEWNNTLTIRELKNLNASWDVNELKAMQAEDAIAES